MENSDTWDCLHHYHQYQAKDETKNFPIYDLLKYQDSIAHLM